MRGQLLAGAVSVTNVRPVVGNHRAHASAVTILPASAVRGGPLAIIGQLSLDIRVARFDNISLPLTRHPPTRRLLSVVFVSRSKIRVSIFRHRRDGIRKL